MKIWTVYSIDDKDYDPIDSCVLGSYTSRKRAIEECVDYIIGRLQVRDDLAFSMAHDENHLDAGKMFSEDRHGSAKIRRGCLTRLREYLAKEIDEQCGYFVCDGSDTWEFHVEGSEVSGEMWHTVTWGDSDCEDPDFTTPYPEDFTSEESAVQTFMDYVKDLYHGHHMKWSDRLIRWIKDELRLNGKVQVDLNDGCCVSCVLYHSDAKNIKE